MLTPEEGLDIIKGRPELKWTNKDDFMAEDEWQLMTENMDDDIRNQLADGDFKFRFDKYYRYWEKQGIQVDYLDSHRRYTGSYCVEFKVKGLPGLPTAAYFNLKNYQKEE